MQPVEWIDLKTAALVLGFRYTRSVSSLAKAGRIVSRKIEREVRQLRGLKRTVSAYEVLRESVLAYAATRGKTRKPFTKKNFKHDRGEECRCSECRSEGLKRSFQVRLTDEELQRLQDEAKLLGMSMNDCVRLLMDEYFDNRGEGS